MAPSISNAARPPTTSTAQKQVSFTITHFVTANRFVSKSRAKLKTVDDLKGKTVVSTSGTTNIKQITEINAQKNLGLNILTAKDHPEAFLMVETDRAAAFVMDDILLYSLVATSKTPKDYVISADALSVEPYGIMLRRDDPAVQEGRRCRDDGDLQERRDQQDLRQVVPRADPAEEHQSQCPDGRGVQEGRGEPDRQRRPGGLPVSGGFLACPRGQHARVGLFSSENAMRAITLTAALAAVWLTSPAPADELTGTLKKIKDTGAITIGHRESSVPFSYYDDKQQVIGYSMDICARLVAAVKAELKLGTLAVKLNPVTSATRIALMANGTIDLECGSTTNDLARQKQVAFAVTDFVTAVRFVSKKANRYKTVDDLKGKTVVSTSGTLNIKVITELNGKKNLGLNIIAVQDHAEAFLLVETGPGGGLRHGRYPPVRIHCRAPRRRRITSSRRIHCCRNPTRSCCARTIRPSRRSPTTP